MLKTVLANPLVQAAIGGVIAAAAVDFQQFKKWQSWHDGVTYAWGTATFRWFQGAVLGLAGSATLSGLASLLK